MRVALLVVAVSLGSILITPGVVASHDPNDFFATEFDSGGHSWRSVFGLTATNVYAGGVLGTTSAIAHYTGSWALETVPDVGDVAEVWAQSATNVFAAASGSVNGNLLRYTGTWAPSSATDTGLPATPVLTSVWGFSATDVWAVGVVPATQPSVAGTGFALHWDGSSWDQCGSCSFPGVNPLDVWGFAANDVWIVGATTALGQNYWHYDGVSWSQSVQATQDALDSIWGPSGTETWAVGGNVQLVNLDPVIIQQSTITHEASGVWTDDTTNPNPNIAYNGVWGTGSANVWAVGELGTIIHNAGGGWTTEPTTIGSGIFSVWCFDAVNCWIAGAGGIIQKLQVNPAVAVPTLTGLQWDPGDLTVHTSEAQCLGDEVTIGANFEPSIGLGGFSNYILNSDTGVVVEQIPTASFHNLNNKHLHTSRTYPAGEYSFLVTADVSGLLAPDNWAAETFSVPAGTCLDSNQDGHDDHMSLEHFDQDLLHPGGGGSGGLIPLSNFPGISLDDSTGIFLLFILMLWALTESLFFLGAASLMGIMATWLGSLDPGGAWDGGPGFAVALGLVILAVWVEAMVRAARNARAAT